MSADMLTADKACPEPVEGLKATKKRGPNTERGKRAVSRNAVKHGILSPHPVVIAGLETIEAWEEFEGEIVEYWQPVGRYERELVADIAFGLWRFRRCRIHESAQISRQVEEVEGELQQADAYDDEDDEDDDHEAVEERELPPVDPVRLRANQHLKIIPDGWSIDRILRYETHVRRALLQTVHELEVRQAHRKGEQSPLARVDFTAGPSLRRPSVAGSSVLQQINQDMALAERGLAARKRVRANPDFLAGAK